MTTIARENHRTPILDEPASTQRWILAYVALLLLEGMVRKWLVSGTIGSLVGIARDPIAIILIWRGYKQGLFKNEILLKLLLYVGTALAVSGWLATLGTDAPLVVWLFGLRTACLHFAAIPIMARLIKPSTIQTILFTLLVLAGPIALLMTWQYRSPEDAWINRVTFDGGKLLLASGGKVRPPGPFSFATGAAEYFAVVNAILAGGLLSGSISSRWLIYGLSSSALAASVSGSRLFVFYSGIVWLGIFGMRFLRDPKIPSLNRLLKISAAALALATAVSLTPFWEYAAEGWQTTTDRFEEANDFDGGIIERGLNSLSISEKTLNETPTFGHGLGLGSNFASRFQTGKVGFILEENEWPRMIQESGLIAGSLFIFYRLYTASFVVAKAWQALGRNSSFGAAFCFSCLPILVNGNIVRPTSMGFVAISMTLALATSYLAIDGPGTTKPKE